ncbi:unnamed protein product [Blepharisma stoltei]|uniref:Thioredoxin-like fold domain-containing protein n=1 Tax=Blepharisma stoltei TaxID=1481888 RepID=A0AAU9JS83_9CILI|nr:unnamed protein product [Blepharisma stoltei]
MKILLGVLVLSLASAIQVVPIPKYYDGYYLGPAHSNYTLETFIDLLCPKSAAAFPALIQYYTQNQHWLELIIHQSPMSYNTFSFPVSQAGKFVLEKKSERYLDWVYYWFQHQQSFTNNTASYDFYTANNKIAQFTSQSTGLPINQVTQALSNQDFNTKARVSWKFGASRNIPGTPSYLLNGVWVPDAYNITTVAGWTSFFQAISSGN